MAASTVSRRRLYKKVTSKKLPGGCQNKELTIFKEILLDLNNVEEFYFCNYFTPFLSSIFIYFLLKVYNYHVFISFSGKILHSWNSEMPMLFIFWNIKLRWFFKVRLNSMWRQHGNIYRSLIKILGRFFETKQYKLPCWENVNQNKISDSFDFWV